MTSHLRSHLTLALCTLLHAFTHAYGTILVPLYLLIVADLRLSGVGAAAAIVTIYGLVYNLGSYAAGVLADRFNRKLLLGIGLLGNAAAITAMGLTRQYEMLVLLGVLAGMFGTLFHPCANALVPAHYPKSPAMAIGILGMGSGIGFFAGPQFAGWRAQSASWQFGAVADWQRPCVELGLIGLACGVLFLIIAADPRKRASPSPDIEEQENAGEDAMLPSRISVEAIVTDLRGDHASHHVHLTWPMRNRIMAIAAVLGWRDFAGVAAPTLLSIYLQKAHGYTPKHAGLIIGSIMLLSILINPLAVYLSPGKRRLPGLAAVLILGGLSLIPVALLRAAWVLPIMSLYQCFQLGSYAMSDAAMLERVSPMIRGRVVGMFLTLAGTIAAFSPWVMGFWTDRLEERAHTPSAYLPIFCTLGAMMAVSALSTPLIARLEKTRAGASGQ